MSQFESDGFDYNILTNACLHVAKHEVPGMVLEIGTRRGGSAEIMVNALTKAGVKGKTFVVVDPYGDIDFELDWGMVGYDYTNQMRDETIPKLHKFMAKKGFNFVFMNMEDVEFFKRYSDGVPIYQGKAKQLINQYALVFVDGPHSTRLVSNEANFFADRIAPGGAIVFDNVNYYEHDKIEQVLFTAGFIYSGVSVNKKAYFKDPTHVFSTPTTYNELTSTQRDATKLNFVEEVSPGHTVVQFDMLGRQFENPA